jgi:hypothetical protein
MSYRGRAGLPLSKYTGDPCQRQVEEVQLSIESNLLAIVTIRLRPNEQSKGLSHIASGLTCILNVRPWSSLAWKLLVQVIASGRDRNLRKRDRLIEIYRGRIDRLPYRPSMSWSGGYSSACLYLSCPCRLVDHRLA